jgi:hypothetical protein
MKKLNLLKIIAICVILFGFISVKHTIAQDSKEVFEKLDEKINRINIKIKEIDSLLKTKLIKIDINEKDFEFLSDDGKMMFLKSDGDTIDFDLDFDFDFDFDKDFDFDFDFDWVDETSDLMSSIKNIDIITDDGKVLIIVCKDGKKKCKTSDKIRKKYIIKTDDDGKKVKKYDFFITDDDEDESSIFIVKTDDDIENEIIIKTVLKDNLALVKFNIDITDAKESEIKAVSLSPKSNKLDIKKMEFYTGDDGIFSLRFKLNTEGRAVVKVVDDKGEVIFNDKIKYFPGIYNKEINLSIDDKGIYYLHIVQGDSSITKKLKIQ